VLRIGGMTTPVPTREAGLRQLAQFLPHAGADYQARRNTDFGPDRRDNVSQLSGYLRHRLIDEVEVLRAVTEAHGPRCETFVREVLWRAYFKGYLEQRPQTWARYGRERDFWLERLKSDAALARRYDEAVNGRTGIEAFDAFAQEMVRRGHLHNHARMWLASIWVFTLGLPWELGADWTFRNFLDGDAASNTLSWRWVAGLHTRGKAYLATRSNIETHTDGRLSASGLAELAAIPDEPEPGPAQRLDGAEGWPNEPYGLLLGEDDLGVEAFALKSGPLCVAVVDRPIARSVLPLGEVARGFTQGALDDAARRAEALFGMRVSRIALTAEAHIDWAQAAGVRVIAVPYVPQGPSRDRIEILRGGLRRVGISLAMQRRRYDERLWPLATKGYFAFRQGVGEIDRVIADQGGAF
jgi:deoxyribodipyrimidine photo-lyase